MSWKSCSKRPRRICRGSPTALGKLPNEPLVHQLRVRCLQSDKVERNPRVQMEVNQIWACFAYERGFVENGSNMETETLHRDSINDQIGEISRDYQQPKIGTSGRRAQKADGLYLKPVIMEH